MLPGTSGHAFPHPVPVSESSLKERPLPSTIEDPPVTIGGILARLGPGLIIAGSIVGSGELIGTTKTGAEAGFWLLWLIIIGCVIKVFVQVELGRDAIIRGKTTLTALSEVPGPAVRGRGNWLIWYYFLMFAAIQGTPFVALPYAGKVSGFLEALGLPAPPLNLVNAGRLIAYLDESWDRRRSMRTQIAQALPALQERAKETHRILLEVLTGQRLADAHAKAA